MKSDSRVLKEKFELLLKVRGYDDSDVLNREREYVKSSIDCAGDIGSLFDRMVHNIDALHRKDLDYKDSLSVLNRILEIIYDYHLDDPLCFKWFKKASEYGLDNAICGVGHCQCEGIGTEKKPEAGVELLLALANKGIPRAQTSLGDCYYLGLGLDIDYSEAFKWYLKAGEQGLAKAQEMVGDCYRWGKGVEENLEESAKWYQKSADQGWPSGQDKLGTAYRGWGVKKDLEKSFYWYKKASDQGFAIAQRHLGKMYGAGEYVEADENKALELYLMSAKQNDIESQYILGCYYMFHEAVGIDYEKSVYWFRLAAERGYADAQWGLGHSYLYGKGVAQDYSSAFYWLRKSAAQNSSEAYDELGCCYYYGRGLEQDYKEAFNCFSKAVDINGISTSQLKLGDCYFYGYGVEKDYEKAFALYEDCAFCEPEAAVKTGDCYLQGLGKRKDVGMAIVYYEVAQENGSPEGCFKLGQLYDDGDVVKRDYLKAASYYNEGAKAGHPASKYYLAELLWNNREIEGLSEFLDLTEKEVDEYVKRLRYKEDKDRILFGAKRRKLIKEAAECGYSKAVLSYANILCSEKDRECVDYFLSAAENGSPEAQYRLGCFYAEGDYVDADIEEAVKWFRKSKDQGYLASYIELGKLYCMVDLNGGLHWRLFDYYQQRPFFNEEEGIELLLECARKNYGHSKLLLGEVKRKNGIIWSLKNTKGWPKLKASKH